VYGYRTGLKLYLAAILDTAGGCWSELSCVPSESLVVESYTKQYTLVHGNQIVHGDLTGVGFITTRNIWLNSTNC